MCVFGDKMQQAKEMPLKTLMTNSENTSSTSSFKMVGSRKNQGYAMHHKSFGVETEKHKELSISPLRQVTRGQCIIHADESVCNI